MKHGCFSQTLPHWGINVPDISWDDLGYMGGESFLASAILDAVNDAYLFTGCTRGSDIHH